MKLFHFTREEEHYIDRPHVSIKVWIGCPAGCDCDYSYKRLKKDILYSKEVILSNIHQVKENFSEDFDIFIVGLNVIENDFFEEILESCKSVDRKFKIQISHKISDEQIVYLTSLVKKYWTFNCSIPKTIDNSADLYRLISLIKRFSNMKYKWKIYFDVFLDIDKYSHIIRNVISKLATIKSNNEYNCIIWNSFDLKFHDLSWKLNKENKSIENLKRTSCMMQEYFLINKKKEYIYLDDHIEISPNWDLVFHDNLCYLGAYKISNIKRTNKEIIDDFQKYSNYLQQINMQKSSQSEICYQCINKPFHY